MSVASLCLATESLAISLSAGHIRNSRRSTSSTVLATKDVPVTQEAKEEEEEQEEGKKDIDKGEEEE